MKRITKEHLLKLKGKYLIADMRNPVLFRHGSVIGSKNLPLRNFMNTLYTLDKKTKLILLGSSPSDRDVIQGMNYAHQMGFDNIYHAVYDDVK